MRSGRWIIAQSEGVGEWVERGEVPGRKAPPRVVLPYVTRGDPPVDGTCRVCGRALGRVSCCSGRELTVMARSVDPAGDFPWDSLAVCFAPPPEVLYAVLRDWSRAYEFVHASVFLRRCSSLTPPPAPPGTSPMWLLAPVPEGDDGPIATVSDRLEAFDIRWRLHTSPRIQDAVAALGVPGAMHLPPAVMRTLALLERELWE